MEESKVEMVLALIAVFGAVVFILFYWIKKSPLYCDCFDGPHEFNGERAKCQYEKWLEAEIKEHAITKSQLVAAVGDLGVAQADVSRLHKELDYLQMKYERLKEKERVTVLPDWSELETDPRKIVFGGEEVSEDDAVYQDRRA